MDGSGKEADSHEVPALNIPEIRDHILKYCDFESIKACALVSKSWRDSSVNFLRTSSVVVLCGDARGNPAKETKSLSNFIKFLRSSNSESTASLYANFELRIPSLILESQNLVTFWSLCGRNLKALKLSNCNFYNLDLFRSWIFKLCPNMTELNLDSFKVMGRERPEPTLQEVANFSVNRNLKSLTINCKTRPDMTVSWLELFGHFPALEILKLTNGPRKEIVSEIFSAIITIRQANPEMLKLRHIRARIASTEAGDQIPDPLTIFLDDPEIHLESLSLNINSNAGDLTLKQILNTHGATLKTLILGQDKQFNFLHPMKVFPLWIKEQKGQEEMLIKLKELRLQSRVFTGMEFLKFMPNLRKLFINDPVTFHADGIIPATNLYNMRNVKLSSCHELEFVNSMYPHDLANVMKWIPNVQRLKMPLNDKTFALVCQNWQNMRTLHISCCRVTEAGLTGLDPDYVQFLNGNPAKFFLRYNDRTSTEYSASISCLKGLRTLCMENNMLSNTSLGHVAAMYGISKLPNLNLVKIKRIPFKPEILLKSFRKVCRSNEVEYRKIVT